MHFEQKTMLVLTRTKYVRRLTTASEITTLALKQDFGERTIELISLKLSIYFTSAKNQFRTARSVCFCKL